MNILKNNYNKEIYKEKSEQKQRYPRKLVCEMCQSELEYNELDLRMGAWGSVYVDCPLCGHDNMLENDEHSITLTVNNIEFPTHFTFTSKETGAIDVCNNEEVKKNIRKAVEFFRKNKNEFAWYTEYGNLYICVYRWGGDAQYQVIVTDNYYGTDILFESEDY